MIHTVFSIVLPLITVSLLIVEIVRNSWYIFDLSSKVRQMEAGYREIQEWKASSMLELIHAKREVEVLRKKLNSLESAGSQIKDQS